MREKKFHSILLLVALVWGCSSFSSASREKTAENESKLYFYINNQQEFDKYKNSTFSPGSMILFAKGAIFNGQFAPRGSGTAGNPIVVGAYDKKTKTVYTEDIEEKPVINGHGEVSAPLLLKNIEFWEVNNLEITNTNGTSEDQGKLFGIHVIAQNNGETEHIVIKNCYVHDVNGNVAGKQRGGIYFSSSGYNTPTAFHHTRIENNLVENVGGVGIHNRSSGPAIYKKGYNPCTDVVVRGNYVERSGRNGIIVTNSSHPIIEYNTVAYSSRFSVGHSIFNFNTKNAVMQYNEVYGNTGGLTDRDRGGFDADWNSEGTIIQYNYAHDNNWFVGIMRKYNKGVKIRYNISQNELLGSYKYGFSSAHEAEDIQIYNNTHYSPKGVNGVIFVIRDPADPRTPIATTFKNNIFYFGGRGTIGVNPGPSTTFDHNLFYHMDPIGSNSLTADPLFKNAVSGGTDIDMKVPDRLAGYHLQSGSPAIDAGVKIPNNGGKDFWGQSLYNESPDIGAHEYQ